MRLEARIPISPTSSFLNRTLLLAASLRRFYPDTIVRAYVGQAGGPTKEASQRVEEAFSAHKIGWEWVGKTEFDRWGGTRSPYVATMNKRWAAPVDGDAVLIFDADVICAARFDELLEVNAVQGVQAHVAPFNARDMDFLHTLAGMPEGVEQPYPYSGNGIMGPPDAHGPFYPNSGMVYLPKQWFEAMIPHYHDAVDVFAKTASDTYWTDQIALMLAAAKAEVPVKALPPRYNFPNQHAFDQYYPGDLSDVRFIHYLRTDTVDREKEFADLSALRAFVRRTDLSGSNEVLRETVAREMHVFLPPPLLSTEDAPYA